MEMTIDYRPHEKQMRFHESEAKFRAILTGVGFGKTSALVNEVIKWAASKPSLYAIGAPTYPLLANTAMREFFKFCPAQIIEKISGKAVKFVNGAEILFIQGDDERDIERCRGLTLGGYALDEVTLFPYLMWQVMIARLRDPNGAMKGICAGTPKGNNWTKSLFADHMNPNGNPLNPEDYAYFGGSTLDNPFTPQEYKATMMEEYSGIFAKQEIYGMFVSFEGAVFSNFRRDMHVIDASKMKFEAVIGGIDFGFTSPSVMLKIGIDPDGRLYITDEFYERRVTDSQLADHAKENFRDVEFFIADSENPSGIQEFNDRGMDCRGVKKKPLEPRGNFVMSSIKKVASLLEPRKDGKPRLFVDKRCVNTIMEFENYRYPEKAGEKPEAELPLRVHDHAMSAIRYVAITLAESFDKIVFLEEDDGDKKEQGKRSPR